MGRDLLRAQNDLISSPLGQGQLLVQGGLPIANGIIGLGGELRWLNPKRPRDSSPENHAITFAAESRERSRAARRV